MNRFFAMMRYNKRLLILFICFIVNVFFVLSVLIFDIIHLIMINKNAVNFTSAFLTLNIILICVVSLSLLLVIVMFVLMKIKGKRNEFEEN